MKALELEPYSIEESEKAAGHGIFLKNEKRVIQTQPNKEKLILDDIKETDDKMQE